MRGAFLKMKDRDSKGKFIHGHEINLLRDKYGRFRKKDKEKTMDKKQDISMIENRIDKLLEKAGL